MSRIATKYTNDGGRICLTIQQEDQQAAIPVQDTGAGIAPEHLPRIFDLFTQADRTRDRSQSGLGIGLALVHRLVAMHGRTVEAKSTPGEGSEFIVRLPSVPIPAAASFPSAPRADETGAPSLRVLVVHRRRPGSIIIL